jgi:glutamine phosphoribosylpyrophosphate amidotransferase
MRILLIDATLCATLSQGEMVVINEDGLRSSHPLLQSIRCILSMSTSPGRTRSSLASRNRSRHKMGKRLAIERRPADIVVPVPDSGVPAAITFRPKAVCLSFWSGVTTTSVALSTGPAIDSLIWGPHQTESGPASDRKQAHRADR